jgi:hypothetical protein
LWLHCGYLGRIRGDVSRHSLLFRWNGIVMGGEGFNFWRVLCRGFKSRLTWVMICWVMRMFWRFARVWRRRLDRGMRRVILVNRGVVLRRCLGLREVWGVHCVVREVFVWIRIGWLDDCHIFYGILFVWFWWVNRWCWESRVIFWWMRERFVNLGGGGGVGRWLLVKIMWIRRVVWCNVNWYLGRFSRGVLLMVYCYLVIVYSFVWR